MRKSSYYHRYKFYIKYSLGIVSMSSKVINQKNYPVVDKLSFV